MPDLLFEIGTEELPPSLIENLSCQILENIQKGLTKFNIDTNSKKIKIFNTPRRLAFYIKDLPESQKPKTEEIRGPSAEKAYDPNGNPTEALIGFAKRYNINKEQLTKKKINNTEYIFATIQTPARNIKNILIQILPESIKDTTGTKFMRWGKYEEKFSRPIRWILAIIDNEIINFNFAGVESSNYTIGHRILSNKKITINNPSEYEEILESNFVTPSREKRKEKIKQLLIEEAGRAKGVPIIEEQLLEEVINITEYPDSLIGKFDSEFLLLPTCVIKTVLNSHQKYFALADPNNKNSLLPNFITITNTKSKNNDEIKKSNEKVIKARLKDAQFFFQEDLKFPFDYNTRKGKLEKITFQKGLGSVLEKVERITKLSEYIYEALQPYSKLSCTKNDVIEASKLCKLDLTTHMVFEFPELQGEIGGIYAQEKGYSKLICNGIKEHYTNTRQDNDIAQIIGIADKLDNILSLFAIDKIPTGSADPFSLRGQTQWLILNIESLQDKYKAIFNISEVINHFKDNLTKGNLKEKLTDKKIREVKDFLIERLKLIYKARIGCSQDLIDAVFSVGDPLNNIYVTKDKIVLLNERYSKPKAEDKAFLIAAKRLVRIIEPEVNGNVDINSLTNEHEKELLKKFEDLSNKKYKNIQDFLNDLSKLTEPINTFFDKVLVNDPDPNIKQIRQALLKKGKDIFERICDFNQIVER